MSSYSTPKHPILVYVLRMGDTDYFKVGVSTDIAGRIAELQTAMPFDLHLVATAETDNAFSVEKDIHRALRTYCVRSEWFQCEQDEILRIFNAINAMAVIDKALDDPALEFVQLPIPVDAERMAIQQTRDAMDRLRDTLIVDGIRAGMTREQIREKLAANGLRAENGRFAELRALVQSGAFISQQTVDQETDEA